MSSLKIEERFSVHAPVERVWRFLLDPEQIAPCLPGAELLQVENERTFHGQMKVKVGPVTVAYQGTIELTAVDEAGRRVEMLGKGKEKGGAGSAKMTMESRLEPQDDGQVAISVISDVELAGRIVRFGRGMIQSVSAQLFKQFAGNVRQALEGAADEPAAATVSEAPPAAAATASETSAAAEVAAASEPPGDEPVASEPVASETPAASETVASETPAVAETPAASETPPASEKPMRRTVEIAALPAPTELVPRPAEPVRVLPLLFRALWDVFAGFFKRLLGRKP